jgi:hypothetical protein
MKRSKELLTKLRRIAEHDLLNLTSEEVLGKAAFGLDGVERKLVFLETINRRSAIIDVFEIESCSMNVIFGNIHAGDLENEEMESFIQKIYLRLACYDDAKSIELTFYDRDENQLFELPLLRQKAARWKIAISQLLAISTKKRA